jgi:tellurite resistance protein TehA-like permease
MAIFGWLLPVVGLGMTASTGARLVLCLVGIAISVFGIAGVLNKAHQKHAIWKA